MSVIIILTVVAAFFINLFFIDNIYKIVERPNVHTSNTDESINTFSEVALVYGKEDLCSEISDLLIEHNIFSHVISDIDKIDKSFPYKYLLAVCNDDLENLTVCSIAVKIMGMNNILAICNKSYNQKIYEENHITYLKNSTSASDIVFLLLNYNNKREV